MTSFKNTVLSCVAALACLGASYGCTTAEAASSTPQPTTSSSVVETETESSVGVETGEEEELSFLGGFNKGRRHYCCHENVGERRCRVYGASSKLSAFAKCQKHWPGRAMTIHRGACNH